MVNINLYSILLLCVIIIISSIFLQFKLKELFSIKLSKLQDKINTDTTQDDVINNVDYKLTKDEKRAIAIRDFTPIQLRNLTNISNKQYQIKRNETHFNNTTSFKYGESLYLSTYHWGNILEGNKFNNRSKAIHKLIKIKSASGKQDHQSIKYGDYITIPQLGNNRLYIHGSTYGNSIFPGNYFYIANTQKGWRNLQINWCWTGWWENWCKDNQCADKNQWHWWWRWRKRRCTSRVCGCNGGSRQQAIYKNRNRGSWERMTFRR